MQNVRFETVMILSQCHSWFQGHLKPWYYTFNFIFIQAFRKPPPIVFDRNSHITCTQLKLNKLMSICMRIGWVRIKKKANFEIGKAKLSKRFFSFSLLFWSENGWYFIVGDIGLQFDFAVVAHVFVINHTEEASHIAPLLFVKNAFMPFSWDLIILFSWSAYR